MLKVIELCRTWIDQGRDPFKIKHKIMIQLGIIEDRLKLIREIRNPEIYKLYTEQNLHFLSIQKSYEDFIRDELEPLFQYTGGTNDFHYRESNHRSFGCAAH